MNFARVAAAAVVAWIVSIGIGYVVTFFILADILSANAAAMRPEAEMMSKLPLGFVFLLVGYFAFAYAYAKGYEGGSGVMEGVRFGVVVALMLTGFALIWIYVQFPINATLVVASIIDTIVEFAIYGAIVGAIYKPLGTSAKRAAAA